MKNNIIRDFKLKSNWLKKEYVRLLFDSIMRNKTAKKITKAVVYYKLATWQKKYRVSFQKRTCIILGKNRSVHPKLNLKRHTIKKVNATCLITGLSTGKW